ncbi:MAG: YbaK/EbsC family protein [Bacteroidetes bacterium]|nr:YbaK/EbsC family protein [Bacteroidota bacterium]MBU1115095.1 YbaK/EbsC family protein [Bacteroidota bacterium]MBU1796762.1 YbaK/EbsC family protein [Bacteroidota bacterium]
MPSKTLKKYLDDNNIKYITINHSEAYTAQEIAASAHIKGDEFAKTVILKIDGKMVMAVLPASYKIDFKNLVHLGLGENIRLANEMEFKDKFPECEVGAMPPFGNLYNIEVYTAESLMRDKVIAFNSGTHKELIKMKTEDFVRLVEPEIFQFSKKTMV